MKNFFDFLNDNIVCFNMIVRQCGCYRIAGYYIIPHLPQKYIPTLQNNVTTCNIVAS